MLDTRKDRVDRFGMAASILCVAHCAISALLPTVFTLIGAGFLLAHFAEWTFTLVAAGFAATAMVLGWRREGSVLVMSLLAIGVAGLLTSRLFEEVGVGGHKAGVLVGAAASIALVFGHVVNIRERRRQVC